MRWIPLSRHYACPRCKTTWLALSRWVVSRT